MRRSIPPTPIIYSSWSMPRRTTAPTNSRRPRRTTRMPLRSYDDRSASRRRRGSRTANRERCGSLDSIVPVSPALIEEAVMFERYTEKARRVIFFSRYEASQFGASQIEAEHILLGLVREDKNLTARFFHRSHANVELIRKEIENRTVMRDRISSQIDLPLSDGAKRALSFAAEESDLLGNRHIGTEHLLLGLLREENSIAAEVLYERGLRLSDVRSDLARQVYKEQRLVDRTQELPLDAAQSADVGEWWTQQLSEACIDAGLFTQDELLAEFARVASLRQFKADTEALLRMLAAKGLVNPKHMLKLVFDLRDEKKLAEFIEKLRQLQAGSARKGRLRHSADYHSYVGGSYAQKLVCSVVAAMSLPGRPGSNSTGSQREESSGRLDRVLGGRQQRDI